MVRGRKQKDFKRKSFVAMNILNIRVPLINDRCWIFWPYSKVEVEKWLEKKKIKDVELIPDGEGALGSCVYTEKKGALVFLKRWRDNDYDRHVLVHELTHAASFIRHAHGIEENNEKNELLAHIIDHLTKKAFTALSQKQRLVRARPQSPQA
jgi:Zn-dependent peptidase ImmA (M78 family)